MYTNSFMILEKEWEEFQLGNGLCSTDFMNGRDISWVSQVTPFIEELTMPGQLVFDPFAGLGTTLLGAGLIGRKSLGFEVDKPRSELLQKRLEKHRASMNFFPEVWQKDALHDDFPENIDAIVTNPPYFHAGKQKRSKNLYGLERYTDYLEQMEKVIVKCNNALPEHGKIVLFCENIRTASGEMLPQAYDMCKILQKYCILHDERIIVYKKALPKSEKRGLLTNRAHEYVFICSKRPAK